MTEHLTPAGTVRRIGAVGAALGLAVIVSACGAGSTSTSSHGMDGMTTTTSAASTSDAAAGAPSASSATPSAPMPAMPMSMPPITPGPAATGPHNAADVAFATQMISHHGQAVQMSDMVLTRGSTADVKTLAEKIKAAQTPEIATMSGWLKGWGQQVPDPYATMAGDMGGMSMGGLMTAEQMHQLDVASGTAADKVFLTLMPVHHRGAIEMARAELAKGANPAAKKLARVIITAQTAEIATMRTMLATLG